MGRDRKLERGVTLVELIVVVAIATALLFLAVPVLQANDVLGSAVRTVTGDAIEARSMARAGWESVTFDVDVPGARWRTLIGGVTPVVHEQTDALGWRQLPSGVGFQTVAGSPTDAVFLANGRVLTETTLRMTMDAEVWQIVFQELTGRVSAEEI